MKIELQPSHDVGYFNRMVNHPEILPAVRDDRRTGALDLTALDDGNNILLKVLVDDREAGFIIMLVRPEEDALEMHSGMLPDFRGRIALEVGRRVIDWAVHQTSFRKLVTWAWDVARHTCFMARIIGFTEESRSDWPYTVAGKKVQRVLFNIDLQPLRGISTSLSPCL